MQLVYLDESVNSGENLDDPQHPCFLLGSLIVPERRGQRPESPLESTLASHFPGLPVDGTEFHGNELRNGTWPSRGVAVAERILVRNTWLRGAPGHSLKSVEASFLKRNCKNI